MSTKRSYDIRVVDAPYAERSRNLDRAYMWIMNMEAMLEDCCAATATFALWDGSKITIRLSGSQITYVTLPP